MSEALVEYNKKQNVMAVGNSAIDVIRAIPDMSSQKLHKLFVTTLEAERAMFVIRGAAAYEMYVRAVDQGKEFTKTKGNGVDAMITEIAKEAGIDSKTLYKDFKIFELFGDELVEKLATAPESILPREFYAIAAQTSATAKEEPTAVLEYFNTQREVTGGYFTDHARRDIKRFNEGMSVEDCEKLDAEERIEAVSKKKEKKESLPKEQMVNLPILASQTNIKYSKAILSKYGTFSLWFDKKCRDEFGAPEELND